MQLRSIILAAILFCCLSLAISAHAEDRKIIFGGGPAGGTFQVVANSMRIYPPVKAIKNQIIIPQASAGSVDNIQQVNSGVFDFAVVYSGHLYLGYNGKMKHDTTTYKDVLAVSFLYGAPAQLVVRKDSGIKNVHDLAGKRVGVGNNGSGAFANCELFFSHLGIWDKISRSTLGYNDSAADFSNNKLDAFWLFTAFPSGAVRMAAQTSDIELLNLDSEAAASGFYKKYPYLTKITIPPGTYRGIDREVASFQDSALWVANARVSDDLVYEMLSAIYTDAGLAHMVSQRKIFKEMSIANGIKGIVTPMHPGAIKFWTEKGIL